MAGEFPLKEAVALAGSSGSNYSNFEVRWLAAAGALTGKSILLPLPLFVEVSVVDGLCSL